MNHRTLVAACAAVFLLVGTVVAATTAGYLDTTFGVGGIELIDDPAPSAITSDDGYLAVASEEPAGGGDTQWVVYRYEADGSRDTTFGDASSGRTTPLFGDNGQDDEARVVVEAPDGRILVAGSRWSSSVSGRGKKAQTTYDRDIVVACFDADGVLDTSFGDAGYTQIDVGPGDRSLHMAVRGTASSYSIHVCGYTLVSASSDGGGGKGKKGGGGSTTTTQAVAVLKLDMDGGLDTSFGDAGVVVDNISTTLEDTPYGMVVDDNDRPVVSVFQNPAVQVVTDAVVLVRYTSSGAVDTSFSGDGRMMGDSTLGNSVDRLALDSDGTSLILGKRVDPLIARYDDTGSQDTVFDLSGLATDDELHGLHVDASGDVVALFWVGPWTDYALTVGRFLSNGGPDTTFGPGADGLGEWTEVDVYDAPESLLVRSDGKIMLIGSDPVGDQTIIARYTNE